MPLFLHDDGRVLLPTARRIWELLLSDSLEVKGYVLDQEGLTSFERCVDVAETQGKTMYEELLNSHRARLAAEREKGEHAFAARRRAIERIGLPAVRNYRLTQLSQEERTWREQLGRKAETSPELACFVLLRVGEAG